MSILKVVGVTDRSTTNEQGHLLAEGKKCQLRFLFIFKLTINKISRTLNVFTSMLTIFGHGAFFLLISGFPILLHQFHRINFEIINNSFNVNFYS